MQPHLQRVEIEAVGSCNHDFAVDHAAARQMAQKDCVQVGKVAIERALVAALNVDIVVPKDDRAESVPLGLV